MTFHDASFAYFSGPPAAPPNGVREGTREDQLNAMVDLAYRDLAVARQSDQPAAARTACHFILGSQSLLNRWLDRRNRDDEEEEEQQKHGFEDDLDWEATRTLFESNREIFEIWKKIREELAAK